MKILLIGNPNVGKSALFSRLTGTHIIASNYPGTTVEFTKGYLKLDGGQAEVIDVPGTYTLDPTNKAEEVAVEMLNEGDVVIDVVDATNLERNLSLTLQLIERQVPLIVALNMSDDARHRGITIDASRLEELLGVPVVPTVGTTGQGMRQLVDSISRATVAEIKYPVGAERWTHIGSIVDEVQTLVHRHHTWREVLEDISNHPVAGVALALFVVAAMFWIIRLIGEGIISYITDPIFNRLWTPVLMKLSPALGADTFWHHVLIGKLINGEVDYLQSFGLLSSGLYIPFAAVLPYLVSFYLILGLLEDIGYLPRLAVLMDTVLHRVGLHGFAIIPTVLGMGCNVPAVLATRSLESYKQRFIASTLISIAVPCASLQAMIIGLVGQKGMQYVALVYGVLFFTWAIIGLILNRFVKGFNPELLLEIPPFRMPPWSVIGKKLWMRILGFLKEALPIVLAAILVVNLLYVVGVFDFIAKITAPLISGLLGLPGESVVALVIGFLRKDVAMGMLAPLDLTAKQLVISSTVLAMSFPCVATFVVLVRELGVAGMLKATGTMIVTALVVGGLLNAIM
jgi:ferrous iron transport protein B